MVPVAGGQSELAASQGATLMKVRIAIFTMTPNWDSSLPVAMSRGPTPHLGIPTI